MGIHWQSIIISLYRIRLIIIQVNNTKKTPPQQNIVVENLLWENLED